MKFVFFAAGALFGGVVGLLIMALLCATRNDPDAPLLVDVSSNEEEVLP